MRKHNMQVNESKTVCVGKSCCHARKVPGCDAKRTPTQQKRFLLLPKDMERLALLNLSKPSKSDRSRIQLVGDSSSPGMKLPASG
eukprot:3336164-Amphidinium_carterae.2